MKISVLRKKPAVLNKFEEAEWDLYDQEHYGREAVDWNLKVFYVKATIGKEIVGLMKLKTEGGVGEIPSLIVSHKRLRQGIGRALIKKAEEITKKEGGHKLHLMTGKTWKALPFYKSLGFIETGELKDHYFHTDFIDLVKFI